MMVYQNDELLVHYQPKPEEKQNQYSGTKSFTSTAVGFAVQEGLFLHGELCAGLHPTSLLSECAVFPLAAAKGEEGLSLFCAVFHPATEPVPHIL